MEQKEGLKHGIKRMIIAFIFIILLIIAVLLYSRHITTVRLDVNEYRIVHTAFEKELHGYKIAHVSDIHYGSSTTKKELEVLVERINQAKPDILIFTGDLIDKDTPVTEELIEELESTLKKLDISILKYEVKGEDDARLQNYGLIMENASFVSLNDTYDCLYVGEEDYIFLAGFKTRKEGEDYDKKQESIKKFLTETEKKPIYSIFVMHEPDMIDEIEVSDYHLILAGHTHGGQIRLPKIGGIVYPKYGKKHHQGYEKIGDTDFYISSGIGTTSYRYRLFNNPSFNLYRLVSY